MNKTVIIVIGAFENHYDDWTPTAGYGSTVYRPIISPEKFIAFRDVINGFEAGGQQRVSSATLHATPSVACDILALKQVNTVNTRRRNLYSPQVFRPNIGGGHNENHH